MKQIKNEKNIKIKHKKESNTRNMSSLESFIFRVLESTWRAWLPVKILARCLRVHYPESSRNFPDKFYFRFYARWLPSLPGWCGLDARMMAAWSSSSEESGAGSHGASCRAAKLFHILKLPSRPLLLLGPPHIILSLRSRSRIFYFEPRYTNFCLEINILYFEFR